MKIKPFDVVVVFLLMGISLLPLFNRKKGEKKLYLFIGQRKIKLEFKKGVLDLNEKYGINMKIAIDNDKARILKSDCPLQICVKTGWISECNDSAVCVPNRVALMIKCEKSEIDAISK